MAGFASGRYKPKRTKSKQTAKRRNGKGKTRKA